MEAGLGDAVPANDRILAMKLACEETTSSLSFHYKCLVPALRKSAYIWDSMTHATHQLKCPY